jgi:hypothetical protein
MVEHDVLEHPAHPVRTFFELAIRRMMDGWLSAGRIKVSARDAQLAREFLQEAGCTVEDLPGARVRVVSGDGHSEEMTREQAVVAALRQLARRAGGGRGPV